MYRTNRGNGVLPITPCLLSAVWPIAIFITVALAFLKIKEIITWSWWLVFTPIWLVLGFGLILVIIIFVVYWINYYRPY